MCAQSLVDKKSSPVLVSACLLGVACRYDGQSKPAHIDKNQPLWPVCPEVMAGMGIPRPAIERRSDGTIRVLENNTDVRPVLERACLSIVDQAIERGVSHAVLKDGSPSCGSTRLWSNGKSVSGQGLLIDHLRVVGIVVTLELE